MSDRRVVVLDASVGVKWMKDEVGTRQAEDLLEDHRQHRVQIVVPDLFVHEFVSTAVRVGGPDQGAGAWRVLRDSDLLVMPLDDALAAAAFEQCAALGCTFYDALAPALARLAGGTLYSADRKAHGGFDGVVLI